MAVRTVLKQPEKNAQRDPGEKGWLAIGKEGHLKRDCPQASKPPLAQCPICKRPHWKKDCPQRWRFQGSDVQDNQDWRCPGVPTQAPGLITPEEPWVLITVGGPIHRFPFGHWGNLLGAYWSSWPTFSLIGFCNGTGLAKRFHFSCPLSCNWNSELFSHEFLIVLQSPSPLLGRDILSKVHASPFMNMEPSLSLQLIEQNVNPRVWADGKSVGWAQNAISVAVRFKDLHLFPHKKQYPLKPEVKEGLKPIIGNWKEQGLLNPCNNPCNTPILGIKKSNDKWRLVQDLQIINEAIVPLCPWCLILILYCLKFLNEPNIFQ